MDVDPIVPLAGDLNRGSAVNAGRDTRISDQRAAVDGSRALERTAIFFAKKGA